MTSAAIDDIKEDVEARIDQACKEVKSNTCSGFLHTLWLNYPEMDFSFFSDQAVEEVKRYAVEAIKNTEAATLLDSSKVVLPTAPAEG